MISMQRSLSSPVRTRDPAPLSPGPPKPSSGSPTPPHHAEHADVEHHGQRRPRRSPSTERAASSNDVSLPIRRSDDAPTRGSTHSSHQQTSATLAQRPLIAHTHAVRPSTPPPPAKSATPEAPPKTTADNGSATYAPTLLPDLSLYTNPFQAHDNNDGTTLEELAHLVRLSKYQERKRANTRLRLQRNLVSTALSARLTRCGEIARRNLVDCFRNDDKKTFAPLYNAIQDVRKSCDELRRYALLEPELDSLSSPAASSSENLNTPSTVPPGGGSLGGTWSFLSDVPASARETFLNFLAQIRTNPDYLASRLCSLTAAELNALTSFHHGLDAIDTVLPHQARSATRPHATSTRQPASTTVIERLLSFQRHDPLSALIHTCFANSAGPDSAEDRRRTDVWATALARLMTEAGPPSEHILMYVLNAWTAMRDWAGRSNMEWYLMKILEDGAFILDRAEDQSGTRFNLSKWDSNDTKRTEDFYDRAVHELFGIVDDLDAPGIPEGLVELGNAVLKRLDRGRVDTFRDWFVYKWLFSSFLPNVIIHPESYGMLAGYHITAYGRRKILREVAMRAQRIVVDLTYNKSGTATASSRIQAHVENIVNRFNGSQSRRTVAKLLPARSITSLRETVEVHPYLVVSPADLVTLVNALFPERRPMSAQSGSLRSAAPSISGLSSISQPISMSAPRGGSNFETASVLSTSASSIISDATASRETALEEQRTGSSQRHSPSIPMPFAQQQTSNYEEDGYRLRFALKELTASLGPDAVQGSCHPCAERWAVLFISSDGNSLSTQMTYDPEDEVDEEENSSTSDTDEDDSEGGPELDKDYHQLRDSILRLVQDFEIPQSAEPEASRTQFSNRATGIKKYRSKNKIVMTEKSTPNRNPYRKREPVLEPASPTPSTPGRPSENEGNENSSETSDLSSVLTTMLNAACSQSRAQSDFVSAHLYWKTLQQLNAVSSPSLRRNGYAVLLNIFSRGPRDSIRRSASAVEEYDAWLVWLKQSQERHEGLTDSLMKRLRALRDKMWYVTDVRHSSPYEQSANICAALKTMGMPRQAASERQRASTPHYLHRTEAQIMDLLSASEGQGGPNKLSDDQTEKTSRWLRQADAANFCGGEERLHRFCCEIDICISRLTRESIMDSPVLWSSELFVRDRKNLEGSTKSARDRDSMWSYSGDDTASVISDPERRYTAAGRSGPVVRDLRNMSGHNFSQQSIDSGSYRFSRASVALSDVTDGPDYFGVSSPIHTIDSSSTYWSPFQSAMSPSSAASRAHSPTTSVTNLSSSFQPHHQHAQSFSSQTTGRPGTSASSNETVYQQRLSEEKSRFLDELRQTLMSLLLSDLGNLVFAQGSETDMWFGKWGQDCIEWRNALEKRTKRSSGSKEKSSKSASRLRVIEKKKSFGNLRGAGDTDRSSETETASAVDNEGPPAGEDTSARGQPVSKSSSREFPFKRAFQRLLRMFCVHPSPYGKLNALYELEQLIVASLASSSSRRSKLGWAQAEPTTLGNEGYSEHGRTNQLEEVIDNVKERHSQALSHPPMFPPIGAGQYQTHSGAMPESRPTTSAGGTANTDAIINVLRSLMKDASIRPKTLFRDLQFISAFVSPAILDKTDKGKAFWNTGLAALGLKSEVCRTMLKLANDVQRRFIENQKHGSESSHSSSPSPMPPSYTLADAGKMWTVLAKEGDPAAQRELALFYLGTPDLVERTTLPLVKPSEVFKQAVMDKYDRGSAQNRSGPRGSDRARASLGMGMGATSVVGSAANVHGSSSGQDGGAGDGGIVWNDPELMCIAIHFFQAAEQGGDEQAASFMRQNDLV